MSGKLVLNNTQKDQPFRDSDFKNKQQLAVGISLYKTSAMQLLCHTRSLGDLMKRMAFLLNLQAQCLKVRRLCSLIFRQI